MHHLFNIILATHYPPKDSAFNWFFGPQLLGAMFLLIGSIQHRYPSKKINDWYGYRTDTSKRNQQIWDDAQRFSALFMIKAGVVLILIGLILVTILNLAPVTEKVHMAILLPFTLASAMAPAIAMIAVTEKYLTQKFGEK